MKRAEVPLWERIILTPEEMASLTGIGSKTIREYCLKGQLPNFKVGNSLKIPREQGIKAFERMAEERKMRK